MCYGGMGEAHVSPRNQEFFGLVSYYRKFVEGFSKIAALLARLMKEVRFDWDDSCENNFLELKQRLDSAPVLVLPTRVEGYVVYTNVLIQGLGAILMQHGRVIAYASR